MNCSWQCRRCKMYFAVPKSIENLIVGEDAAIECCYCNHIIAIHSGENGVFPTEVDNIKTLPKFITIALQLVPVSDAESNQDVEFYTVVDCNDGESSEVIYFKRLNMTSAH